MNHRVQAPRSSFVCAAALFSAGTVLIGGAVIGTSPRALAQEPVAPSMPEGVMPAMPSMRSIREALPSGDRMSQGGALIAEAFDIAGANSATRPLAVRGAAALLPRLSGNLRRRLTQRWMNLALAPGVPRSARLRAFAAFFDVASRQDPGYARAIAMSVPDAAARAGAYISLSERAEGSDWQEANRLAVLARRAARAEGSPSERARALTFVAYRLSTLNPETREDAVIEASAQARALGNPRERDYLLTEVVGAAAQFDLVMARRIAEGISNPELKNLATARVNMSQVSQTTQTTISDRVAAVAKQAARYDVRAIPILLQLPAQADVLKALSDSLPPIYPTARPAITASSLERMWTYAGLAQPSVYRDQLQSRLARLMVLNDLWRGRSWGKQLAWKGGRVQVGAFLKNVITARRSALRAEPLQDLAQRNVRRAIVQARTFAPATRVEALLLIAGQLLA